MKLINERGKLFGIINLVDLFCLLVIALLLLGVGWKLLGPQVQEAVAPQTKMTTTFRIRGAYEYTLRWLGHNELVGEQLIMGNGYIVDAYVTGLTYEPFVRQEPTAEAPSSTRWIPRAST